jgi:hypothetical protein
MIDALNAYLLNYIFLSPILDMLYSIKSNGSFPYLFSMIKSVQFLTFFTMYLATPKLNPLQAKCKLVLPFLSAIPNFKEVYLSKNETVSSSPK